MNTDNTLDDFETEAAMISIFEFGGQEVELEEAQNIGNEIVQMIAEYNGEKAKDFAYVIAEITKETNKYLLTFAKTPLGGGHILLRWHDKDQKTYVPNIVTAVASTNFNVDDVEIVPLSQHPDSTYSFEKAVDFLVKKRLLSKQNHKSAYVTTVVEKNKIKVFGTQEQLHSYCNEIAPLQVLCSKHPSVKKANSFAKKLKKQTPWFDLELA